MNNFASQQSMSRNTVKKTKSTVIMMKGEIYDTPFQKTSLPNLKLKSTTTSSTINHIFLDKRQQYVTQTPDLKISNQTKSSNLALIKRPILALPPRPKTELTEGTSSPSKL